MTRAVALWLSGVLVAGTFAVLTWLERRRPLRRSVVRLPFAPQRATWEA